MSTRPAVADRAVAIHGWGFSSPVWRGFPEPGLFPGGFQVRSLPGYDGVEAGPPAHSVPDWAKRLAADAEGKPATWVGWSLGGLVAIDVARAYPARVTSLILIASTPRFQRHADWPNALAPDLLQTFKGTLTTAPTKTMARFAALCAGTATPHMRTIARQLRAVLDAPNPPSEETLQAGLNALAEQDYREALAGLRCPVLVILGDNDPLVPAGVAEDIRALNPGAQVRVLRDCAHAPFLSHPQECQRMIEEFLHGLAEG